jgi:hypothetical protein
MGRNFVPELFRRKGLMQPIRHRIWFQKSNILFQEREPMRVKPDIDFDELEKF